MLDRLFVAYRFKALQRFIFEQLDQLYQLGVLVSLVLYTALPGLVLIIYLALGKLVVNDPDLALLLCVSLIVFQTELSTALSEGVRDTRNRLFQRSLLGQWHLILLDTLFGLLTNVVFLLCLPLLYSMGLDRLEQASHFLLFITVIVLSGLFATFKPQVTKVYIFIVVLCACLLPLSFSAFLIVCIACLLIALCLPLRHLLGQQWDLGFWCGYHRHNFAEIWWRILVLSGLVMCAFVIFDARPDLGVFVHCLISPFLLHIALSQQLNHNQLIAQYQIWFASLGQHTRLQYGQFFAPFGLCLLSLVSLQMIVESLLCFVAFSISGIVITIIAFKKPRHFSLAWFAINASAITMCYLIRYS